MKFRLKSDKGKVIFIPKVDWSNLSVRADIDTININVEFDNELHTNRVRPLVKRHVGDSVNVIHSDEVRRDFHVSLQDPNPKQLYSLSTLEGVTALQIKRVDVAFDLLGGTKDQLLTVVQMLAWSLDINNLGMDSYRANPRVWQDDMPKTLRREKRSIGAPAPALPRAETFYFGDRHKPGSVKVYLKTINEGQSLPVSQYRARIEVTLAGQLLTEYGLDKVDSFASADLSFLRRLFKFKLPTISRGFPIQGITKLIFKRHHWEYIQAGMWLWDDKPSKRKRMRLEDGSLWEPRHRRSRSFIDLNKRVNKAFGRLNKRWSNQSVPEISPLVTAK